MRNSPFFDEIEHVEVPWGERVAPCPVFYYDVMSFSIYMLAPTERVRAILPSPRLHPYRVSPRNCIVTIVAFEYRDSDIGPYNEVSISVPVTLDRPSPLFTGSLRSVPGTPKIYIHHLPVTTEIARDLGVEFAGYPKFLADIDIDKEGEWVSCDLRANGKHILTLKGRKLQTRPAPRSYTHPITFRNEHLLRCEMIASESETAASRDLSDVRLELGDHPIAQELRGLDLGRIMAYRYSPHFQAILTPVFESFPVR
jgi:hypothetical protein